MLSNINEFDIYIAPTSWGATSTDTKNTAENRFILDCIQRQQNHKGEYDLSLQVALPNEWKPLAAKNIGLTAAVETDRCNPYWIDACNKMDKVIVVSDHAGKSITNHKYPITDKSGNQAGDLFFKGTMATVGYPVKNFEISNFAENLEISDSCFLSVLQAAPRKNYISLIKCFLEEFWEEDIGLLLKMNFVTDSIVDRGNLFQHIESVVKSHSGNGERKCKIHLLHGRLSEDDLHSLYVDKRMKGYLTTTHGEGFGLPVFEAAYSGLPVIAPNWSGYLDFMRAPYTNEKSGKTKLRSLFLKTKCEIKSVSQNALMKDIISPESKWAYVDEGHFKKNMRSLLKSPVLYFKEAKILKEHIEREFSEQKIFSKLLKEISGVTNFLEKTEQEDSVLVL
ncbi:hypothetical protein HOH51_04065 [bacterium]|nr:hypothetical protein [bacterium]